MPEGQEAPLSPNPQMAKPREHATLGHKVEQFSRRLIGPLLATAMTVGIVRGTADAINQQADQDTGYRPNQPGQVNSPKPPSQENPQPVNETSFWQNNSWVNEIRQKLSGEGLNGSEEFLANITIVSKGEPGVIGPNLREYPSNFVPPGLGNFNGTEVPILGILLPGGTVDKGIIIHGTYMQNGKPRDVEYVAFRLSDYHGSIVNDQKEPVELNPQDPAEQNRIVVAARTYLQPQTQTK